MMRSAFSKLVSHPENIQQTEISDLDSVVEAFPYCQIAHLLLAKKLKQTDSMLFEKQLNLTAAYAPSRKVLFDLVEGKSIEIPDEIKLEIEEKSAPEEDLNNQMSAVHSSEEKPEDPAIEKDSILDQIIRSETSTYDIGQLEKQEPIVPETSREKIDESAMQSFSDWIQLLDQERSKIKNDPEILVQKFIEEEPRIGSINVEVEASTNLAKPSSGDLDVPFVTETLAKIHLDQGNRTKAVEIYEALKLKYPEKSPYFAAQINFIKQQQH